MQAVPEVTDIEDEIRTEIENKTIQLPTLPEVALKVRDAVESESAGADTIARMVAHDAALAARLLQVANSPLYGSRQSIDSLQQAVARLGLKMVRSLVVSLAMRQMFQATSEALDHEFRAAWDESLQVASISRVLATKAPELENEQAMLGGLIHNIGALPILTKLDEWLGFHASPALITRLIQDMAPEVGALIMRHWNFSDSLANIPTACVDLGYDPGPRPTYADIVLVARLQHQVAQDGTGAQPVWSAVPAFAKLGMDPAVSIFDDEELAAQIAQVRQMLDG